MLGVSLAVPEVAMLAGGRLPPWVLSGAAVDLDFANANYFGGTASVLLTCSRASSKTDLLPSSAPGAPYNTFANNVLAISPGSGLLVEGASSNLFLNSTAPVTQTITLPATGSYTLWVNGSGSASVAAGTATITGAGAATNGAPVVINCSVAGTVVVTKTGALNAAQLEAGGFGTSLIVTAGASATRAADSISTAGVLQAALTGSSGTAVVRTSNIGTPQFSGNTLLLYNNNAPILLFYNGSFNPASYNGTSAVTGSTSDNINNGTVTAGVAWDASGRSVTEDNAVPVSDGNGMGTNTGSMFLAPSMNGYVRRLTAWTARLSDAALQAATNGPRAPAQAAAAGFTAQTFDSSFATSRFDLSGSNASGKEWYLANYFGATPSSSGLTLSGNSLTMAGLGGSNGQISSAATLGGGNWVGTAFGGGAYFEATIRFNPSIVNAANGWPSFWSMAIEHLAQTAAQQWTGQVAGFNHYIEADFFESDVSNGISYGGGLHDWYGTVDTDVPSANVRPGISGMDWNAFHKVGMLWVPATAGTNGSATFYLDDVQQGSPVSWSQFTSQSPPPGGSATWTFGVFDGQHVALMLGTGTNQSLIVESVRVWQASAAGNLVH